MKCGIVHLRVAPGSLIFSAWKLHVQTCKANTLTELTLSWMYKRWDKLTGETRWRGEWILQLWALSLLKLFCSETSISAVSDVLSTSSHIFHTKRGHIYRCLDNKYEHIKKSNNKKNSNLVFRLLLKVTTVISHAETFEATLGNATAWCTFFVRFLSTQ